ncbi:hypothetical protein Tco_0844028 [Tanacetum coccineum]
MKRSNSFNSCIMTIAHVQVQSLWLQLPTSLETMSSITDLLEIASCSSATQRDIRDSSVSNDLHHRIGGRSRPSQDCPSLEDVRYQNSKSLETCTLAFMVSLHMSVGYEHAIMNLESSGICSSNHHRHQQVEFNRISLTGFRSCTSRSQYRSVSKQTTRYE